MERACQPGGTGVTAHEKSVPARGTGVTAHEKSVPARGTGVAEGGQSDARDETLAFCVGVAHSDQ